MSTFAWPAIVPQGAADNPEQVLAAARAQGHQEGYAQGQQQALLEQADIKQALAAALQDLLERCDGLAGDYDAAVTQLIFTALQALLRVELVTNPEVIASLVAEALAVLNAKLEVVTVRAHPDDVAWLQPSVQIEVTADDTVPMGGLAVAMPDLCVEFDLLARLREVSESLSDNPPVRDHADESSPGSP